VPTLLFVETCFIGGHHGAPPHRMLSREQSSEGAVGRAKQSVHAV
jgi:hypothetical protein